MSAEIESLTTDVKSRRTGQGVSPMLVALVVLGLLLAVYAHWRFGQFDRRIDRLHDQVTEFRGIHDRLDASLQTLTQKLESSQSTWRASRNCAPAPRLRNARGCARKRSTCWSWQSGA